MSFWTLSDNSAPKGDEASSFAGDFRVIPDGTCAPAQIKSFKLMDATQSYPKPVFEVTFKLIGGDFKDREVRLKVKCFDDKPTVSDRGINMLKRIYDLCGHKPTHADTPTDNDLLPMIGKIMGVKIREFIGTNSKTGEPTNGNYVSEIHSTSNIETVTGTKLEVVASSVDTAFSRNAVTGLPLDDSGIPF